MLTLLSLAEVNYTIGRDERTGDLEHRANSSGYRDGVERVADIDQGCDERCPPGQHVEMQKRKRHRRDPDGGAEVHLEALEVLADSRHERPRSLLHLWGSGMLRFRRDRFRCLQT